MGKYLIRTCHNCLEDFSGDLLFRVTINKQMPHNIFLCNQCMSTESRKIESVPLFPKSKYMKNFFSQKIDSYFIDDNHVLHTFIKEKKHVTISDVKNDKQAKKLIKELNSELNDKNNLSTVKARKK